MSVRALLRPTVVAALALAAAACQDVTAPLVTPTPTPPVDAARSQALSCTVDVRARQLACAPVVPVSSAGAQDAGGPQRTLVIGGQGVYVRLYGSAATPTSPGSDTLTVPVAVQNLLSQPLGTTDGVSYDGRGVMVFFAQAPTTTSGTGAVTVVNPDSTGTFTAAGQQAFVYPQFLAGNQSTVERNWRFRVPASVTAFHFQVYVRAQLQNEVGALAVQPARVFAAGAAAGIIGSMHTTCGVRTGAGVYCWGTTSFGGAQDSTSTVPLLVPGSGNAVALGSSANSLHACWLTPGGTVSCVGDNTYGQLGDGGTTSAQTARAVQMPNGVTFSRLVLGSLHTCALSTTGAAYCWGWDQVGQLGDGGSNNASAAVAVQMPAGVHFTAIGTGPAHTCGISSTGAAYCWGINVMDQLGAGSLNSQESVPVAVQMPAGVAFTQIGGGAAFTCALTQTGSVYCWGDNSSGQLGDGTTNSSPTPILVHLPVGVTLTQLAVGAQHACGRASDGAAYCWGDNTSGELGDGTTTQQATPVAVLRPSGVTFAQLSAGGAHSCGLTAAGAAYCWGNNADGQIGDGTTGAGATTADRSTPTAVRMP